MSRILQISDPHFGTEQHDVVQALLALAHEQRPDIILFSGDITQRARRHQFAAARAFADSLPAPVMAVPGNHDIPLFNLALRLFSPYGNYRRAFGDSLEPEFENDDLLIIGVNTTCPRRHKDGEVSPAQIQRVARRLQQASARQLRIVMQHHPVKALDETDISNLLIGREQAVPSWIESGLDILVAGHIHLPYIWPLYSDAGPTRKGWTAQAGTAVSSRVRGSIPNSVNLLIHERNSLQRQCTVERWDYSNRGRLFVRSETSRLDLDRSEPVDPEEQRMS